MSEKTSFARVARAVLAVDELQQQLIDLTALVKLMSERLKALETSMARRE